MDRSVISLLLAVILLELGSGLQGVLIPIRSQMAGFSAVAIGGLGTLYYVGFVVGCLALPATVRRVGHIRCFSALAALAASLVLLQAMHVEPWSWLAARAAIGFCFAGMFMILESWLSDRSAIQSRGRILAMYMICTWLGVVGGKLLFSTEVLDGFPLFAVTSVAIALSLVPIALTNGSAPAILKPRPIAARELYLLAPVGFVGCFGVGVANGAFWTFAPLFAQTRFVSSIGVSLFMVACVIGGALAQWPVGRVSDSMDRRYVICGLSALAGAAGILLFVGQNGTDETLIWIGMTFGAFSLPIYSVCVAHANDRSGPESFVDVSSHLLLVFGLGAAVGPVLMGILATSAEDGALFALTAIIHLTLAAFVFLRIQSAPIAPAAEHTPFVPQAPVAHATQAIIDLRRLLEDLRPGRRDLQRWLLSIAGPIGRERGDRGGGRG